MTAIDHQYAQRVAEFTDDEHVHQIAGALRLSGVDFLDISDQDGAPSVPFITLANDRYRALSGTSGQYLGEIADAVMIVAYGWAPTRYEIRFVLDDCSGVELHTFSVTSRVELGLAAREVIAERRDVPILSVQMVIEDHVGTAFNYDTGRKLDEFTILESDES